MAKFDTSASLPQVFKNSSLSILPVTRGVYCIGNFDAYKEIDYSLIPKSIVEPMEGFSTLKLSDISSESSALLYAYNSGLISNLLGEELAFTVFGRMSSGVFDYSINIKNKNLPLLMHVENAQLEIDGAYESALSFYICEAKNYKASEFIIRQLYYPYRLWEKKLKKRIVPIFMVFSNDIFYFLIYNFLDVFNYNSLVLEKAHAFEIYRGIITIDEINKISFTAKLKEEWKVPFPQADNFERIVDLLGVLREGPLSPEEVTFRYNFAPRQTNYYISAAEYLGLITRGLSNEREVLYRLSDEAEKIMVLDPKPKNSHLQLRFFQDQCLMPSGRRPPKMEPFPAWSE
jgi:hypothetical protein